MGAADTPRACRPISSCHSQIDGLKGAASGDNTGKWRLNGQSDKHDSPAGQSQAQDRIWGNLVHLSGTAAEKEQGKKLRNNLQCKSIACPVRKSFAETGDHRRLFKAMTPLFSVNVLSKRVDVL